MARWSNLMRLAHQEQWGEHLNYPGCYEIGYFRGGVFTAYYVGSSGNLKRRLATYMDPARCHNDYILGKLSKPRHNLYFRVVRTERYRGMEARLQERYGIGSRSYQGFYVWNKRVEWSWLED